MEDAVREIENDISSDSASEEENFEAMGRGRRKKKRKHAVSSEDEETEVMHSASQKVCLGHQYQHAVGSFLGDC